MKKLFLTLFATFTISTAFAHDYKNIDQNEHAIEFFSFLCPHCYSFEKDYQIPSRIKAITPLTQSHVDFLGGKFGAEITRAWSVATVKNLNEQVSQKFFDLARQDKLNNLDDIKTVFSELGVDGKEFDELYNSEEVNLLTEKQQQAAKELKIYSVPTIFTVTPEKVVQIDFKKIADKSNSQEDFFNNLLNAVRENKPF